MKTLCLVGLLCVSVLFAAAPVRAYVTAKSRSVAGDIVEHKWKGFPIAWGMNPKQGPNVTGSRTQADVLNQSFQAWQSVSTASLLLTQGANTSETTRPGFDGINLVTTNTAFGELPTGVLAFTYVYFFDDGGHGFVDPLGRPVDFPGQIVEADVVFSANYQFTTDPAAVSDRIDFQSVATHEAGHFLGLDHATNVSSTMFWSIGSGRIYPRVLSADDIAGISSLYPAFAFSNKAKISGTVRTTTGTPVYGAIVVAVNSSGTPVASTLTDPNGAYLIEGLDVGTYTVFAEPLAGRINSEDIDTVAAGTSIYPGQTVDTNFTTRYR